MGFGGAVSDMIALLKFNARTKRRIYKDLPSHYQKYKRLKHHPVIDKEVSKQEFEAIRLKIEQQSRILSKRNRIFSLLLFIVLGLFLIFSITYFSSNWNRILKSENKILLEKQQNDANEFQRLIFLGFSELKNKDYSSARYYFTHAKHKGTFTYEQELGFIRSCTFDCLNNSSDCKSVKIELEMAVEKWGTTRELSELIQMFEKKSVPAIEAKP